MGGREPARRLVRLREGHRRCSSSNCTPSSETGFRTVSSPNKCSVHCVAIAASAMGAILLLAAVLCAAMLAPAIVDSNPSDDSRLYASDTWHEEGFSMSLPAGRGAGGEYFLVQFLTDCNLVLGLEDHKYWATGTNKAGQHVCYLAMQRDGNLVIYGDHNNPVWASNSAQSTLGNYYLQLQMDGNLVIYKEDGAPIWASQTNWY